MSDSLRPYGLQQAKPPCPSPTPRVYSDLCPLSRRCHPTISSSVLPFSSHLQSFPASGSFQMSPLFTSGGQSIGYMYGGALVAKLCPTLCHFTNCSLPGFSVHGISQQEYRSGLPFLSPEDLPNSGIELKSPALQMDSLSTEQPGKISHVDSEYLL